MNVENIWQTLVFAVAIFRTYAIFALGWPVGHVTGIGLGVVLAPPALLAGAYGLIMLFASDETSHNALAGAQGTPATRSPRRARCLTKTPSRG